MRTSKRILYCFCFFLTIASCKKKSGGDPVQPGPFPDPTDPAVASTIGFFLDGWQPQTFTAPSYLDASQPTTAASATITIDAATVVTKIPRTVFGQNANSWMTQMVTEASLMDHLTNLRPGIIRFPGGSISDIYFWNGLPNQKPADAPDSLLNDAGNKIPGGYWYGKNTDSWTISLDHYYNLLQQTGSQGMITVNYGYARYGTGTDPVASAAHLAADWVRYDNGRTKYWEIGNETNGVWEAGYRINTATNHDAQPAIITGALYARHVQVFVDSMRKAAQEMGKTIYIGAYILEKQPDSWQTPTDQGWNAGVFAQNPNKADFYIIHSYYTPYQQNSNAATILNTASDNTTAMMNYVKAGMSAAGTPVKPVALTEWNITSEGSRQQVSFINGMHATILLGEAIKNKYGETSRWDLANGWNGGNDHGLFNIGDEPGVVKWNPRPAFYYMYYLQKMMGDRMLATTGNNDILTYGSSFTSGEKGVVLVNKGTTAQTVAIQLKNANAGPRFYWYILTGGTDNGEFSAKVYVNGSGPSEPSGGPADYKTLKAFSASTTGGMKMTLPPRSVAYVVIDKG